MTIKYATLKKKYISLETFTMLIIYTRYTHTNIQCEQTVEFGFWNDIVNLSSEVENPSAQKQELISI